MSGAGSLQKLLHLANAREALASGDLPQALSEVDAAVAADASFAAAQSLRREIVTRMSALPASVPQAPVARAVLVPVPSITVVPHPRTHSVWPLRIRIALAVATLAGIAGLAVMIVRSGTATTADRVTPRPVVSSRVPDAPHVLPAADVSGKPAVVPTPPPASASKSTPTHAEPTLWASARLAQLNLRPRWRASAMHVDDAALLRDLGEGISELWVGALAGNEDVIFVGGNVDETDWLRIRASLKPNGVVWRISPHRSAQAADATLAAVAGFKRGRRVSYSQDYVADQFTPLRAGQ